MKQQFYIILSLCVLWCGTMHAQAGRPGMGNRQPNVEALKVAYLTKQLELTPDEAKKFWPVHDAYQADIEKTVREARQKNGDELELEEKLLALRKKYKPEFLKAISEEKFNKMLRVEREFRDMLRREMERRRALQQNRNNPGS